MWSAQMLADTESKVIHVSIQQTLSLMCLWQLRSMDHVHICHEGVVVAVTVAYNQT